MGRMGHECCLLLTPAGGFTPCWCGNRQLVNIQPLVWSLQATGTPTGPDSLTRGPWSRGPMWRCGDSNPVPPACKAGALPSELHPRAEQPGRWWGILDSNQGPQSYQDCALTT